MCQISQQTTVKFTQDRACLAIRKPNMTILARLGVGRVVLHFIAMPGDRCVRFHFEGIAREVPWTAPGLVILTRPHFRPHLAREIFT